MQFKNQTWKKNLEIDRFLVVVECYVFLGHIVWDTTVSWDHLAEQAISSGRSNSNRERDGLEQGHA
jgi:hypothetical protein